MPCGCLPLAPLSIPLLALRSRGENCAPVVEQWRANVELSLCFQLVGRKKQEAEETNILRRFQFRKISERRTTNLRKSQKFINLHRTQLQSYLFIYLFYFNLNHTTCFGLSSGHPQV
jgi:hypothetical protein